MAALVVPLADSALSAAALVSAKAVVVPLAARSLPRWRAACAGFSTSAANGGPAVRPSPFAGLSQQRAYGASAGRGGVVFQDVLGYLQEKHGIHQKAVKEPLSELAQILGYQHLDPQTPIAVEDTEILLQEIGASEQPLRDLLRFVRARQLRPSGAGDDDVAALSPEDFEEWSRLQNVKDLLAFAKKCGASVETPPRGPSWLRVTTADGGVIHFKHVGKKEEAMRKGKPSKEVSSEKKEYIRICPHVEEPIAALFAPQRSLADEAAAEASADLPDIEDAHSLRRRRPPPANLLSRREAAGRNTGPRRRGPSQVGHLHGRHSAPAAAA